MESTARCQAWLYVLCTEAPDAVLPRSVLRLQQVKELSLQQWLCFVIGCFHQAPMISRAVQRSYAEDEW